MRTTDELLAKLTGGMHLDEYPMEPEVEHALAEVRHRLRTLERLTSGGLDATSSEVRVIERATLDDGREVKAGDKLTVDAQGTVFVNGMGPTIPKAPPFMTR